MKKILLYIVAFFLFSFCNVHAAENNHRGFRDAFFSFNTEIEKVIVSAGDCAIITEMPSAGDRLRASISRKGFTWTNPIHFTQP